MSRIWPGSSAAGARIAVIGQAFPYTPIANPGWMFPDYSFGIRDRRMQEVVDERPRRGGRSGGRAVAQRL
jgi:uncharacterized protein YbjT (DUF2867 family)